MALAESPSQVSQTQPSELASIHQLRPSQPEDVFDSGAHYFFQGEFEVGHDTVVWTLEVPENLAYNGLAIFVPGYSGIKGSSRGPRGAFANEGMATATYSPARKGNWYESVANPQILHAKTIHQLGKSVSQHEGVLQHAPNITQVGSGKKIIVAHSMGGLGATEYAKHNTEEVDALYKLASVGYGHPTLAELFVDIPRGTPAAIRHELVPALRHGDIRPTLRNVRDLFNYFRHFRAVLEGNSCLRHDSRQDVAVLRQAGIFVGYQAYRHDILVRPDLSVANHVDHHVVLDNAGHLAPIYRANQVAHEAAQTLKSQGILKTVN